MLYYWKIEKKPTGEVCGHYKGSVPDFERDDLGRNWLETHDVAANSRWVVTKATRMRTGEDGQMEIAHFLSVRQVYPSGYIGPSIRPESTQLPSTVYETTSMSLSDGNLLAIGWRIN